MADGLGSRANSRVGARAATLAARNAWRQWRRSAVGSTEDLIRLVEVCWRLRENVDLSAYEWAQVVVAADGSILTACRNRSYIGLRNCGKYRCRTLALRA